MRSMEPYTAQEIVRRGKELYELHIRASVEPEHEDRFLQLDVQFHLALARAAGNATLETLLRIVFRQLEILRDMAMHAPAVPEWIIDIHERTLEAVRTGERLDEVMDEHLGALEDTLQSA